jgi:XTP/dITP diphosphohydrolase
VALAGPRGEVAIGRGDCEGEILPEERGDHGFGYDPIFLVAGTTHTMAELPEAEKNRISHRARAVHDLLDQQDRGALPGAPLSPLALG